MKVTVKFRGIPELVSVFEEEKQIQMDFTGSTLKDLLHQLSLKIGPKKKGTFLNDRGEILPNLLVLINGKYTPGMNPLSKWLRENDVIELLLAPG